ncbi:hypothetical protein [Streptacidiphilus sp. EB103A]|uniref:hypothetical protein n=1 Tax=Streptacidiphilus sp. EB103A TaxID=3156275 RepID=UPI003514076D
MGGSEVDPHPVVQRTLSDALDGLTSGPTPPGWAAAVYRAAELQAPAWQRDVAPTAEVDLQTLAVALYVLAHQGGREPSAVSPDEIQNLLDGPEDWNGEPQLRAVSAETLRALGHLPPDRDSIEGIPDPVGRIWQDLTYQREPEDPMDDSKPDPSAMCGAVERLRRSL